MSSNYDNQQQTGFGNDTSDYGTGTGVGVGAGQGQDDFDSLHTGRGGAGNIDSGVASGFQSSGNDSYSSNQDNFSNPSSRAAGNDFSSSGNDSYGASGGDSYGTSGGDNYGSSTGQSDNYDSSNTYGTAAEGAAGKQGKPSFGDKVSGTMDQMVGKMTNNPQKIEQGAIKKTEGKSGLDAGMSDSFQNDGQGYGSNSNQNNY